MGLQENFKNEARKNLTAKFKDLWERTPLGGFNGPTINVSLLQRKLSTGSGNISFFAFRNISRDAYIDDNLSEEISKVEDRFYQKVNNMED